MMGSGPTGAGGVQIVDAVYLRTRAVKYREQAKSILDPRSRDELLSRADRFEEIATSVEGLLRKKAS